MSPRSFNVDLVNTYTRYIKMGALFSLLMLSIAALAISLKYATQQLTAQTAVHSIALELQGGLSNIPGRIVGLAVAPDNGDIWLVSMTHEPDSENRLYRYSTRSQNLRSWGLPDGLGTGYFFTLTTDRSAVVLAAGGQKLVKFDPQTEYLRVFEVGQIGEGGSIRTLAVDSHNRVWFSIYGKELLLRLKDDGTIESLQLPIGTGTPSSIVELPTGHLLMTLERHQPVPSIGGATVTAYGMVAEVDPGNGQVITHTLAVAAVSVGPDGSVWAIGGGEGLARLDISKWEKQVVETELRTGKDLVAVDPKGRYVWFTTLNKLGRYDIFTGQVTGFEFPKKELDIRNMPAPPGFGRSVSNAVYQTFRPNSVTIDSFGAVWLIDIQWPDKSLVMIMGN